MRFVRTGVREFRTGVRREKTGVRESRTGVFGGGDGRRGGKQVFGSSAHLFSRPVQSAAGRGRGSERPARRCVGVAHGCVFLRRGAGVAAAAAGVAGGGAAAAGAAVSVGAHIAADLLQLFGKVCLLAEASDDEVDEAGEAVVGED